jgi:tRNA(fMet)-specific endonuclease VapC
MKRYILDSNSLNWFIYRRFRVYERAREARKRGDIVGTVVPIVGELLGGLEYSATCERNRPIVETELKLIRIWPYDLPAARRYGVLYAEMKRDGILMQVIDRIAAASALTIPHCTMVTSDSDFSRVPGLEVEDWRS